MSDNDAARENWARYLYGKDRGHIEYTETAERCEDMYLGGGTQWAAEDKAILDAQGRPHYEFNEVMPAVNAALGHQITNRMDIAFRPRGEMGDMEVATTLNKLVKQVLDQTRFHWLESQVFSDGLIEQRGFFELRVNFDNNIKGDIDLSVLDPRDVIPDPDAKSYDPDGWGDVTVSRWLTLDEIEQRYGAKARKVAEESGDDSADFGDADDEVRRNKFGQYSLGSLYDAYKEDGHGFRRYRVIERQRFVYEKTDCIVFPNTGDVQVESSLGPDTLADALQKGAVRAKRMRKRIKWTVSTWCRTLHDAYSPYEHFTVVPFFAYFRRGRTRGMVDNAIGPQEVLNKAVSQFVHILNSSANGGWMVEENSLANMDTEDLEDHGAETGLVLEYKKGSEAPRKIQPNQVPTGIDRIIDRADKAIKDVTVPEAMRGIQGPELSGIAIRSKQAASQQQLAVPLENLTYTRNMLAIRITKLIQQYYDSHRVFRITETDPMTGKPVQEVLEINRFDPATGSYLNDVTVGEYDVVISEQPMVATFEDGQFQQALEMRKEGIRIPDSAILRYSNLSDKHELMEALQAESTPQPPDPTLEAKAELLRAQARKADADTTARNVESQYSAVQTAQIIETIPATATTADGLLKSAGYVDRDAAPIVPQAAGQLADQPADMPSNPNPMTPANPAVGMMQGIETPGLDGLHQ